MKVIHKAQSRHETRVSQTSANKDTASTDAQHVLSPIDQILSPNGWVAALCHDPICENHLYYINIAPQPKRNIKFACVIPLNGFRCPNGILETIKISFANEAAVICGMDWAEYNGFFIFSNHWQTRDIEGD
ncbi:hypothetical protein K443DRAFT_9188 [Laccaria amethystina LaAM-08-1]|uniref:Uncharacterized protein n=1 Tax=Laccaria amethystina LaAM-08-1 TaxID=1095629 RepID=A0A0C9XAK4_9AGAR|nr:hypothetical protein K443DRAFT_9188 [Laccaria amethystina LaAM-08-1]